jgi:hypothetical protein
VTHLELFDGFNCEPKGENNERRSSWGAIFGSQHFGVEGHGGASGWDYED